MISLLRFSLYSLCAATSLTNQSLKTTPLCWPLTSPLFPLYCLIFTPSLFGSAAKNDPLPEAIIFGSLVYYSRHPPLVTWLCPHSTDGLASEVSLDKQPVCSLSFSGSHHQGTAGTHKRGGGTHVYILPKVERETYHTCINSVMCKQYCVLQW